ncbi:MAG: hypothetical protein HMLIMOIP_000365 [Candidatus Nitrosomirales archaeon]
MEEQIFISHTFEDVAEVNKLLQELFGDSGIKPFIAAMETWQRGAKPNWLWIKQEIEKSKALFLFVTPSILKREHTQNWIAYETGVAATFNPPKPVWIFQIAPVEFKIPYLTHYILMPEFREQKEREPKPSAVVMTWQNPPWHPPDPELQKKFAESVAASVMVGLRSFTNKLELKYGVKKLEIDKAISITCYNCRLAFKFFDLTETYKSFPCPSCAKDINVPKEGDSSGQPKIARL